MKTRVKVGLMWIIIGSASLYGDSSMRVQTVGLVLMGVGMIMFLYE